MHDYLPYQFVADVVLVLHFSVAAFVVGGLVLIIVGNLGNWRWVNAFWFRLAHLGAIAIIAAEAWLGAICPFTTLEMWLRAKAHAGTYGGSFVEHWVRRVLYYEAPPWAFVLGYSLFGLLVAATWVFFPPTPRHRGIRKDA